MSKEAIKKKINERTSRAVTLLKGIYRGEAGLTGAWHGIVNGGQGAHRIRAKLRKRRMLHEGVVHHLHHHPLPGTDADRGADPFSPSITAWARTRSSSSTRWCNC